MNKETIGFMIYLIVCLFINILVSELVHGLYDQPTEFGNLTHTTCWIGGSEGIANCTKFYGDGSSLTGVASNLSWNNTDAVFNKLNVTGNFSVKGISNFTDTAYFYKDIVVDNEVKVRANGSFWTYGNKTSEYAIMEWQKTAGFGQFRTSGEMWFYPTGTANMVLVTTQSAFVPYVAGPFTSDLGNASNIWGKIYGTAVLSDGYQNSSGSLEWIRPENIADVDKEDIESDLNTFVDIDGDAMTGPLNTTNLSVSLLLNCDTVDTDSDGYLVCGVDEGGDSNCSIDGSCPPIAYVSGAAFTGNIDLDDGVGQSPKIRFINQLNNISEIYEQTDGDLYIKAKDGFELAGSSFRMTTLTNCDTIDTDASGVLSCGTDDDSGGDITAVTESGTTPLTFTGCDTGSCAIGMNIDGSGECAANYACTGGHTHDSRYFTETESNTNFVSRNAWTDHDSYPGTCAAATPFIGTIGDISTCRGVVSDTSPQLGGYLDTQGQNIGSTSDEIENVYIATNSKIYLGNGQEGEIYYDGTKLIIKV